MHCSSQHLYSITSSARADSIDGTSGPSVRGLRRRGSAGFGRQRNEAEFGRWRGEAELES
jgi:hypothetical protein